MAELVSERARARRGRRAGTRVPEDILRDGDPVVADPAEAEKRAPRLLGRRVERVDEEHVDHVRREAQRLKWIIRIRIRKVGRRVYPKGRHTLLNLVLIREGQEIRALKNSGSGAIRSLRNIQRLKGRAGVCVCRRVVRRHFEPHQVDAELVQQRPGDVYSRCRVTGRRRAHSRRRIDGEADRVQTSLVHRFARRVKRRARGARIAYSVRRCGVERGTGRRPAGSAYVDRLDHDVTGDLPRGGEWIRDALGKCAAGDQASRR